MLRLRTRRAATVRINFDVSASSMLDAFAGLAPRCPPGSGAGKP
jgi:hypothetical protein